MTINFSNINLEIIDINVNSTPDIFVNQYGITFSKRVLEDMGYPQNVQYCIDAEHHIFAIRACKSNEAKATTFSKPKGEQTATLSTSNKNIRDVIAQLIPSYDPNSRYKITGYYDSENRIMYYDMSEAEKSSFRTRKK